MSAPHRLTSLCAAAALAAAFAPAAWASTSYVESVSGDLSNSGLSPTLIAVGLGSNQVIGTTGNPGTGLDRDYFSIVVPAGAQLSSLTVLAGTVPLGLAFLGVQSGAQVTVSPTSGSATGLLGWSHYASTDAATDILPRIGTGSGANGFVGPLGAGSYAFWIQDFNAGASTYAFDLTITAAPVPEPASAWLLLFGAVALALPQSAVACAARRRRSSMVGTRAMVASSTARGTVDT
jgi:hypothetical protein